MSNRVCWLNVFAIACALAAFLAFLNGARAQETRYLTFCDSQDEIVAVTDDNDAVDFINRSFKDACVTLVGTFVRGKTVETVHTKNAWWDITPVLIYGVGWDAKRIDHPIEQWIALISPVTEVNLTP